jgi:fatty acid desaturase
MCNADGAGQADSVPYSHAEREAEHQAAKQAHQAATQAAAGGSGREGRAALSALNLRMVLAGFGLVGCALLAWWAIVLGIPLAAGILAFLALVALIDLAVIQRRRRQRAAREPVNTRHSLFE